MKQTKRSTFKLLFYLKKNQPKKNGNVAIMARITIDGKRRAFGTKLEINPNKWDLKYSRVTGKSAKALNINQKLDSIRSRINTIYNDMMKDEGFATAEKVKLSFLGVGVMEDGLLKVFESYNAKLEKLVTNGQRSVRTYAKNITAFNHLSYFIDSRYHKKDISFRELTPDFINEFDFYLRHDHQCAHNTVWVYTMPILKLVTIAVKKGVIRQNPFEHYKISMKEVDRGYMLKEDVEKLMQTPVPHKRYELVKDIFIFSCFTGLSYIDIKNLTEKNIQTFFDGHQWIISRRQKSDVASNVRLMDIPKRIIEKYKGTTRNEFIFPVPTNNTCNTHIKKLVENAEIITEQKITFHTARHTFGTMFLTEGIPLESLSKMMGHKNIATTQIYAKITSQKISKDMDTVTHKFSEMEAVFEEATNN